LQRRGKKDKKMLKINLKTLFTFSVVPSVIYLGFKKDAATFKYLLANRYLERFNLKAATVADLS
jgi:hypothetical protein